MRENGIMYLVVLKLYRASFFNYSFEFLNFIEWDRFYWKFNYERLIQINHVIPGVRGGKSKDAQILANMQHLHEKTCDELIVFDEAKDLELKILEKINNRLN